MVVLDRGEPAEVAGCLAEEAGVLLGFGDLLGEFGRGTVVAVGVGLRSELRIHGGVLVGFALDRQLQAAAQHLLPGFV